MKKLTSKQKARAKARIAIAKDVIAQIKAKRYLARTGCYIQGLNTAAILMEGKSVDMRSHLTKTLTPKAPCAVCALGSAFMSCVRIYDKFQLNHKTTDGSGVNYNAMHRKLREFFTRSELLAIENSFERGAIAGGGFEWDNTSGGYKIFLRDLNQEERLTWLMNAIIRIGGENKITFKALERQALLSIVLDPEYEGRRWATLRPAAVINA